MAMFTSNVSSKCTTLDALRSVIASGGNRLILAYGYVTSAEIVVNVIEDVIAWLADDSSRVLELYIGCLWKAGDGKQKQERINGVRQSLDTLFPERLYERNVGSQIQVHVIPNFHAKFCLMLNGHDDSGIPIQAIIGSSNLSAPALADKSRIELDLHLSRESDLDLLESMRTSVFKMLDVLRSQQIFELGHEVRSRCFLYPALDEIDEIIEAEELERRKYYNHPLGDPNGIALRESDIAQGVEGR